MAEGRNTNPFAPDDNNLHLPPTVYQPNPFPYSPSEGNPWAPNDQYYQNTPGQGHAYSNTSSNYGHSYNNTSSDSGSQSNYPTYIPMPTPAVPTFDNTNNNSSYNYSYDTNAYNNNTYNNSSDYNAYSNLQGGYNENDSRVKDEQDNDTEDVEEASAVNPGIETHDPDKLNISSQKVSSYNRTPNGWRLLSRFIQFLASAGAFIFNVVKEPVSKQPTPDGANNTAIIFLYIVSAVSIIYSFGHLIFYCLRRWNNKNKSPRWLLMLIDAVLGACFGILMVFLIKGFQCKPGDLDGWCNFYNVAIFFTVLSFVTYAVSFIWDIVGGFK